MPVRFLPLLLFALLAGVLLMQLSAKPAKPSDPLVGQSIPDFSLPPLEGIEKFSPQLMQGKPALLNIFASWCVSCAQEHALLQALNKNEGIPVYGIAWKDKAENTKAWLAARGNIYEAVGLDVDGKAVINLGLTGVPETYLIGADGKVIDIIRGPLDPMTIETRLLPKIKAAKQ